MFLISTSLLKNQLPFSKLKASNVPSFQKRNSHTPSSSQGQQQPQPQPQQTSSFGDAVKSGLGLGIGMEAVRGVAGALSGSTSQQQQHQEYQHQPFTGIHENDNTKSICDTYHSDLLTCLKDNNLWLDFYIEEESQNNENNA